MPCLALQDVGRVLGCSFVGIKGEAERLGIKISVSPTGRKRISPLEADQIAESFSKKV